MEGIFRREHPRLDSTFEKILLTIFTRLT